MLQISLLCIVHRISISVFKSSYVTMCSNVCIMDVIRQTNLFLSTSSHLNIYRILSIVAGPKIAYLTFVLSKIILMFTTNYAFPTNKIPIQGIIDQNKLG